MDKQAIVKEVIRITAEQLRIGEDQVTLESNFVEDLGADSLDSVELAMAFEDELDIAIPDRDVNELTTIEQVVDYIAQMFSHNPT